MKNVLKTLLLLIVTMAVFIFCSTMQGEGYFTLEAILNRKDNRSFLSALEKENYTEAAEYLGFYGEEDKTAARKKWAENMTGADFSFAELKYGHIYTDDGITLCPVRAILDDGREMSFRVVVQDRELSVSIVHIDSPDKERYQDIMTTYYPG